MTSRKSLKLLKSDRDSFDISSQNYNEFNQIDGDHPFKKKVPGAYVEYPVRDRKGGEVVYFNFALAVEMGLIDKNHPEKMYAKLAKKINETFGLIIINEFDILHNKKIDPDEIRPNQYMATRYLQLQHPSNKGVTSGDGRSIWNGYFKGRGGVVWDVTSCGTGATCLSPATAKSGRYFESGDPQISYGCGYAETQDGMAQAIMSEIYNRQDIPTERCLAVIDYGKGISINVRAGKNLIRPSHFFGHLKQGNYQALKAAVDYYLDRQLKNKAWKDFKNASNKYKYFLDKTVDDFAKVAARFESDYIFCWLDWDGDNILADGGIIDYGSIRQFGLFHHEYRYDDDDRWSTNILEQKAKAKYIVQTFIQLTDFILTKNKKNIKEYSGHHLLKKFEKKFDQYKKRNLLTKLGLDEKNIDIMLEKGIDEVIEFEKIFNYFERTTSNRGPRRVPDGITKDAIYCMRDILRELPIHIYHHSSLMSNEIFIGTIKSSYATSEHTKLTKNLCQQIARFQKAYKEIIVKASSLSKLSQRKLLGKMIKNSIIINRHDKVTGDAILYICQKIEKERKNMDLSKLYQFINDFIDSQLTYTQEEVDKYLTDDKKGLKENILKIVHDNSEGI